MTYLIADRYLLTFCDKKNKNLKNDRKIVKRDKLDTQIHLRLPPLVHTDTSMKSGGVELTLWAQTYDIANIHIST